MHRGIFIRKMPPVTGVNRARLLWNCLKALRRIAEGPEEEHCNRPAYSTSFGSGSVCRGFDPHSP